MNYQSGTAPILNRVSIRGRGVTFESGRGVGVVGVTAWIMEV